MTQILGLGLSLQQSDFRLPGSGLFCGKVFDFEILDIRALM